MAATWDEDARGLWKLTSSPPEPLITGLRVGVYVTSILACQDALLIFGVALGESLSLHLAFQNIAVAKVKTMTYLPALLRRA